MPVRFFHLVVAAWGAFSVALPQETPVPEPGKLFEELRKKFNSFGPFSGNVSLESVEAKGEKTPVYKASFHLRLAEEWLYLETQDLRRDDGLACALFDGYGPSLYWTPGKPGARMHMGTTLMEAWRHQWRFEVERRRVLEGPEPAKNLDAHVAALRPTVILQVELSKPGSPEPVDFRFAVGKSTKGGVSWLKVPARDLEVVATPEEVIVRETSPVRTTAIDRKTGVLRSMRIDLPSGDSRVLTVSGVGAKQAKPEVRLPEQWTDRPARLAEALGMIAPFVKSEAIGSLDDLLKDWPRVGSDDRADLLRDYFAWIGAEQDALNREAARLNWADQLLKQAVDKGASLEKLRRDLDAQAKKFGDAFRDARGEPKERGTIRGEPHHVQGRA